MSSTTTFNGCLQDQSQIARSFVRWTKDKVVSLSELSSKNVLTGNTTKVEEQKWDVSFDHEKVVWFRH